MKPTSLESLLDPSSATAETERQEQAATPAEPVNPEPSQEVAEPPASEIAPEPPAEADDDEGEETGEETPAAAAPGTPGKAPAKAQAPAAAAAPPAAQGQGAPPAPADDEQLPSDVKGLRAANKAERRKRKEYEQQLAARDQQLADLNRQVFEATMRTQRLEAYLQGATQFAPQGQPQQQPQEPAGPPDAVTHPEERLAWERQAMAQELAARQEEQRRAIYETRAVLGQEVMRGRYPDYDEMEALATSVAARHPELRQQILDHPNPAAHTYAVGKRIKLQQDIAAAGGYEAYQQQQIEARVQAEIERRMAAGAAPAAPAPARQVAPAQSNAPAAPRNPQAPSAPPPPQSLATVTSSAPRSRAPWAGPSSIEDLLSTPIGGNRR